MPALSLLPLITASWLAGGGGATAAVPGSVLDAARQVSDEVARVSAEQPVPVILFDENHAREGTRTVLIGRDGTVDDETAAQLERMFRCKRTDRHRPIDRGLLVMLADVAAHYPGRTIEYVSAFRAKDPSKSNHKKGRAFDFRIVGVSLTEVRDYVWTRHTNIGVGWYPSSNFIHMDHRPGEKDYAWTQIGGREHGQPFWSVKARRGDAPVARTSRVGS